MRTIPRCGCAGRCSCLIQGGNGIEATGLGNPNDPYTLDFDGEEVAGRGLGWDTTNNTLDVRVSGSGLGFDASGALVNTGGGSGDGGSGGGGGSGTWPTVTNLLAKSQDVIGGQHGGGYLIKPAQLKRSYEYGIERGLDVLHIPVRFLADGTPVVHVHEETGVVNQSWNGPVEAVQDQDIHRWRILPLEPGVWNPRQAHQPDQDHDPLTGSNWLPSHWHYNFPRYGWFGYLEENQYGLTTLDDVLRLCAGWTVVVINLRWPDRSATTGQFGHPTPEDRTNRFLNETLRLIDKYRMVDSAIIASGEKTIPGGTTTGEISVFERFYNRGISCGMWLENPGDTSKHPPDATWDSMATWVFPQMLSYGEIPNYTAQGITAIVHSVNRQYLRALINDAGGLGVLSGDPEYFAGAVPGHLVHGDYRYRKNRSTWQYDTIDHGLLPPQDTVLSACVPEARGYQTVGSDTLFMNTNFSHGGGDHYVLQGWMCPLSDADNYALDFWLGWADANPTADGNLYLVLAFGFVTDAPFQDWDPYTVPAADPGYSGYTFAHGSNGYTNLQAWDGSKVVSLSTPTQMASPSVTRHHYIIGVNSKGIRVSERNTDGTQVVKELGTTTSALAQSHRGGYVHVGRTAPGGNTAVGRCDSLRYRPGEGTTYGPQ